MENPNNIMSRREFFGTFSIAIAAIMSGCGFEKMRVETLNYQLTKLYRRLNGLYRLCLKYSIEFPPLISAKMENTEIDPKAISEYLNSLSNTTEEMRRFIDNPNASQEKHKYPELFHYFNVYDKNGKPREMFVPNFWENQNPDLNATLHHIIHSNNENPKIDLGSISIANILEPHKEEKPNLEELKGKIIEMIKTMTLFYTENVIETDEGDVILPRFREKTYSKVVNNPEYLGNPDEKIPVLYPMDNLGSLYSYLMYAHTIWDQNTLNNEEKEKIIKVAEKEFNFWKKESENFSNFFARYYSLTGIRLIDSVAPDDTIAKPVGYMINISYILESMGEMELARKYSKLALDIMENCENTFWEEGYIESKKGNKTPAGRLKGSANIGPLITSINKKEEKINPDNLKKEIIEKGSNTLPGDGTRAIEARCEAISYICRQYESNENIDGDVKRKLELFLDHAIKEWYMYLHLFYQDEIYLWDWNPKTDFKLHPDRKYYLRNKIPANGYIVRDDKGVFHFKKWLAPNNDELTHREYFKGATALMWLHKKHLKTIERILSKENQLVKKLDDLVLKNVIFLNRLAKDTKNILYMRGNPLSNVLNINSINKFAHNLVSPLVRDLLGINGKLDSEGHEYSPFLRHTVVR